MEWTLNYGQKLQPKYASGTRHGSGFDSHQNCPHFGTDKAIKSYDGNSCKNVYVVPQLHISGLHVKKIK